MVTVETRWWLPRTELDAFIGGLREDGRTVIGPTVRDGAIVHAEITSAADLPAGLTDVQAPGHYRLTKHAEGGTRAHAFDYAASPTSWKAFTFPSAVPMSEARLEDGRLTFRVPEREVRPMAFLGVRACDLAALRIHDRVLMGGPFVDDDYQARRSALLLIAVECASPSSTCFCTSMGTGPEVTDGFDLALTELDDGFVVRAGTPAGRALVDRAGWAQADAERLLAAAEVHTQARRRIGESLPTEGLPRRLLERLEHPRWASVAERCLACTNCTLVCPTCFCTSVTQRSDLTGQVATSERQWDSCFNLGFASVAGGNFRPRRQDRYRQWLTHKFGTWHEQFGTSGCVGCGRCITWCPVGIDVRDELVTIAGPEAPSRLIPSVPPVPTAASPGAYAIGTVVAVRPETADTWTLTLGDLPSAIIHGTPGQFLMVDLPGFSAAPISISRYRPDSIDLTIRAAGASTRAITSLPLGSQLGLRGPLGRGWPVAAAEGRDVVVVAGGIGLAPLRPVVEAVLAARGHFDDVRVAVGARTPSDLMFLDDLEAWRARSDLTLEVTVDRAGPGWTGPVGVVTQLFDRAAIDPARSTAFVCGPEKMMQAATRTLAGRGLLPDRVFVSMERHMECGIGLCGHCQMGRYFVCRDGPVFSRAELGEMFELEGV
jgi:NAD(P)H-flavin reductase/formate hydrogenlyase subunit 6/NADH:ubiquinone oxidoreductase subunit I